MSLADEAFAGQRAFDRVEDLLSAIYEGVGDPDDPWSEFTFDPYDSSIEVYGCTPVDDVSRFGDAGFVLVWQHPHKRHEAPNCQCRAVATKGEQRR